MPIRVSELGLNIIQFISNLYVVVFLLITGPTVVCWKKI